MHELHIKTRERASVRGRFIVGEAGQGGKHRQRRVWVDKEWERAGGRGETGERGRDENTVRYLLMGGEGEVRRSEARHSKDG